MATMRRARMSAAIWPALSLTAAFVSQIAARAQTPAPANGPLNPQTDRMVCPLSDSQMQKAIAAFAKLAEAFTQEDRCGNCHGGVDPFSDHGHHAGGVQDRDPRKRGDCQKCHSGLPGWDVPLPDMFFMDGWHVPRKASVICKQIRRSFAQARFFINHIAKNTDLADFNGVAFLGTRGLNDYGQLFAFLQPYQPEAPKISRADMVQRVKDWVSAMGGEFEGDIGCGCEPEQFAIHVLYGSSINAMIEKFTTVGVPVDIPISFHDDRTFEGLAPMPQVGAGKNPSCVSQSQDAVMIKAFGDAVEEWNRNHMNLSLTNVTPETSNNASTCITPWGLRTYSDTMAGTDKPVFKFDMPGRVGDTRQLNVPLPAPIAKAVIIVKIVALTPPPANPK